MTKQKELIKQRLSDIQAWCDDEDKSTEFMIAYMADTLCEEFGMEYYAAHDMVMDFLCDG